MENKIKKVIVNSLTISRIIGTIAMPIMFNILSAPLFIFLTGLILLTDSIDGILARHWNVCTIFGTIADQTADKLFALAILIVLTTMFPIMTIPLAFELIIGTINIKSISNGAMGKSSQVGKIKTWIMGLSIFSLLLVGLSPEIRESIKNIDINTETFKQLTQSISFNIQKIGNNLDTIFNDIKAVILHSKIASNNTITQNMEVLSKPIENFGINLDNIFNGFKSNTCEVIKQITNVSTNNKEIIKEVSIASNIVSESIVTTDYLKKAIYNAKNNPEKRTSIIETINELKANKEFIKSIILDEEYNKKTKNLSLKEKLTNNPNKTLTKIK